MGAAKTKKQNNTNTKNTDYYLSLPYRAEVMRIPEEDGGGYTASIPLLGRWSTVGDGETPEEALRDLYLHLPSLIEEWLAEGVIIPEPPGAVETLSGTLSLRLPKTLHAEVAQVAEEGVSINQFILAATAKAIGSKLVRR